VLNPGEVARAARDVIGEDTPMDGVWLEGWPFWHDYRAIGMEARDLAFENALLDVPAPEHHLARVPERFTIRPPVFIVHPGDAAALDVLKRHFPTGQPRPHRGRMEHREFVLFVVPRD
jgi:hypothetical protein